VRTSVLPVDVREKHLGAMVRVREHPVVEQDEQVANDDRDKEYRSDHPIKAHAACAHCSNLVPRGKVPERHERCDENCHRHGKDEHPGQVHDDKFGNDPALSPFPASWSIFCMMN